MSSPLAILDLGSTRTKLYIGSLAENGSVIAIASAKSETGLVKKIQENGEISSEDVDMVIETLRSFIDTIKAHHVTSVVLVATESLRKATNQAAIIARFKDDLGLETNLLSPDLEADTFLAGAQAASGTSFPVADIGGGSVQLAWTVGQSISIPTGTVALEKQFQTNPPTPPSPELYSVIRAHITATVAAALSERSIKTQTFIVGSSCMRDFFDSAMCVAHVVPQPKETYSANEIEALFKAVAGVPYKEAGAFYPESPKFMYGGDKALLNIQTLMQVTEASAILPTNESLSTSLVRLAANEGTLEKIGIRVSYLG